MNDAEPQARGDLDVVRLKSRDWSRPGQGKEVDGKDPPVGHGRQNRLETDVDLLSVFLGWIVNEQASGQDVTLPLRQHEEARDQSPRIVG